MNVKNLLLLGTAYTGKSWASGRLAHESTRKLRVFVHQAPDLSYFTRHGLKKKETLFISVMGSDWIVPVDCLHLQRKEYRNIWFSVYDLDPIQVQEFLLSLIEAVRYSGNLLLVIDEAHMFLKKGTVPKGVVGFFRGSRKWGIDLTLVTHRYPDISIDIRCIINCLGIFRVTEARDLKLLSEEVPIQDVLHHIPYLQLGVHYFIHRDSGYLSPALKISLP